MGQFRKIVENVLRESSLSRWNRIAGFYHLDTKEFELFPRTASNKEYPGDEYVHNIHSIEEFREFKIVRFGIEDIPGEGVVCYIEGDTKRDVEECYYAIVDKYADDLDIVKYELEYYKNNKMQFVMYNRYGEEIKESLNENEDLFDMLTDTEKQVAERNRRDLGLQGAIELFKNTIKMWEDEIQKESDEKNKRDVFQSN